MQRVARLGDDGLEAVDHQGRDDSEAIALTDVQEIAQQSFRQFADGAEETIVAGAGRERTEVMLQLVGVARLCEANVQRLAMTRHQASPYSFCALPR